MRSAYNFSLLEIIGSVEYRTTSARTTQKKGWKFHDFPFLFDCNYWHGLFYTEIWPPSHSKKKKVCGEDEVSRMPGSPNCLAIWKSGRRWLVGSVIRFGAISLSRRWWMYNMHHSLVLFFFFRFSPASGGREEEKSLFIKMDLIEREGDGTLLILPSIEIGITEKEQQEEERERKKKGKAASFNDTLDGSTRAKQNFFFFLVFFDLTLCLFLSLCIFARLIYKMDGCHCDSSKLPKRRAAW